MSCFICPQMLSFQRSRNPRSHAPKTVKEFKRKQIYKKSASPKARSGTIG